MVPFAEGDHPYRTGLRRERRLDAGSASKGGDASSPHMPMAGHDEVMGDMTPEDYESVVHVGQLLHEQGWRKAFTVNEMMDAWESFVAAVEVGYDQLVDEHTNDPSLS
jgi:hypothetical protein